MGWKSLRDHYGIGHIVHVTRDGICIGSEFVHDLIVLDRTGRVIKTPRPAVNEDLDRYLKAFAEEPATVRSLLEQADTFERSIPIYTYEGGDILEKFCEDPRWPNATHDGCLIYPGTFSTNKSDVVHIAKRSARAGIEIWQRSIAQSEKTLADQRLELSKEVEALAKLEAQFSDP